jgi:hypothetical protein
MSIPAFNERADANIEDVDGNRIDVRWVDTDRAAY